MKFTVIAGVIIYLMFTFLLPEYMHAQTYHNVSTKRDVITVAANTPGTQIFDRVRYNPSVMYSGQFSRNAVYYHNPGNPVWRAGLKKEIDYISCRSAQDSLRRTGTWAGHLRVDGACGDTAEPVEWAIGNWLNFNNSK